MKAAAQVPPHVECSRTSTAISTLFIESRASLSALNVFFLILLCVHLKRQNIGEFAQHCPILREKEHIVMLCPPKNVFRA